jgi:hypothetical protein
VCVCVVYIYDYCVEEKKTQFPFIKCVNMWIMEVKHCWQRNVEPFFVVVVVVVLSISFFLSRIRLYNMTES